MNKSRLSLVIAAVVSAAVLAGGWFLGVQPQLALASTNVTQQQAIGATNAKNRSELARLAEASASLDAAKGELARLQASLPSSAQTDAFVAELNTVASTTNVRITSVTIGDAEAYLPETGGAPGVSTTATPTAAPSATATPSPTAPATAAPSPQPVVPHSSPEISGTNFSVIGVTVSVDGSYDQALAFTKAAQAGDRLFLVDGIAAASTDELPPMDAQSWSLTGSIYVLADPTTNATATPSATPAAG